jgi:drug/metabolite transporter (DMT)-like permease
MAPVKHPDGGKGGAVASLIAAMIGFGLIPIFLKLFEPHLDAWTVNGVRYSIGALFWLPFLLVLGGRPAEQAAGGRGVWRDAIVPAIVNIIGQAGFGLSPYYVSASLIGFVLRVSFLWTLVFGFLVLKEERRLARQTAFWYGAILSLLGVAVMFLDVFQGNLTASAGESPRGLGYAAEAAAILLVTALAWGGYSVSVRYWMARYPARQSFGVISLYTSAALVGLMFVFGDYRRLGGIGPGLWANLMLSAMIGIALGHVLYYRGIHRLGPIVASGILLITPFVTYVIAALFLGETLSTIQWIGGTLVVVGGGLLVLARAQIERQTVAAPPDLDDQAGGQN